MEKLIFCEEIYSSNKTTSTIQRLSVISCTDSLCLFLFDAKQQLLSIQQAKGVDLSQKKRIFEVIAKWKGIDSTILYYLTDKISLMPRKLFLYGQEKTYLKNICTVDKDDIIFTDQCDAEQVVNIYAIPVLEDFAIRQSVNGVRTKHLTTQFIQNTRLKTQHAYLYVFDKYIVVYYHDGDLLRLVNVYGWDSWEDVLYKLQEINNEFLLHDNQLVLLGDVGMEDELILKLKEQKPAIQLFSDSKEINLSFIIN